MSTGTVRFVSEEKGYFFVRQDEGGADLFGHFSQLQNCATVSLQDRVAYDVEFDQRRGKERAMRVRLVD